MTKQRHPPVHMRIPDIATARRCVRFVANDLRSHESPLTAEDLEYAVKVLIQHAKRRADGGRTKG